MTHKSKSHQTIADIEDYLMDYSAFPDPSLALVLALWSVATWTYQTFDAFPYLVITSATKRSGKTRLAELLAPIAHKGIQSGAMTPAVLFRKLRETFADGGVTLFLDEAETLSSDAQSAFTAVLNMGYRRGQSVMRTVQDEIVEFPVYCPKVFVLIGDVRDTLRDRSIVVEMVRSTPRKLYKWSEANDRATAIKLDIIEQMSARPVKMGDWFERVATFLDGREAEIWTPLFALCATWCPERLDELTRAAVDLAASKTAEARKYTEIAKAEDKTQNDAYGERLLRDLADVFGNDTALSTDEAIERLQAIPTAPWRRFRGDGLSPMRVAELLSPFDVRPRNTKIRKRVVRGYKADEVRAALQKVAG